LDLGHSLLAVYVRSGGVFLTFLRGNPSFLFSTACFRQRLLASSLSRAGVALLPNSRGFLRWECRRLRSVVHVFQYLTRLLFFLGRQGPDPAGGDYRRSFCWLGICNRRIGSQTWCSYRLSHSYVVQDIPCPVNLFLGGGLSLNPGNGQPNDAENGKPCEMSHSVSILQKAQGSNSRVTAQGEVAAEVRTL
jgi:hypothetical protein